VKVRSRVFIVGLLVLGLLGTVVATAMSAAERGGPVMLSATMSGDQEVPGPGDDDGVGQARISLYADTDIVCWRIRVRNIEVPATAAHIHIGPKGVSGGIVVTLSAPTPGGTSSGCVSATGSTIDDIIANPAGYYVNVHNIPFPGGAVRGQLG
jgi:hypothetical protein